MEKSAESVWKNRKKQNRMEIRNRKEKIMSEIKKIGEIKALFEGASIEDYIQLINDFSVDERTGVISIVNKYKKKLEAYQAELQRTEAMKVYENKYSQYSYICGIDEVGRGPLAGPVCAGAVILPKDEQILYLNDSKKLTAKKREELYDVITEKAVAVKTAFISHEIIDEINILQATYEAMRTAIKNLSVTPDILLNDAVTIPNLDSDIIQVPIIQGDAKSISIAAASIVAKVERDRLMQEYDSLYPEYGFASNKGYGSREHIEAIKKYGPCPIHRLSFLKGLI